MSNNIFDRFKKLGSRPSRIGKAKSSAKKSDPANASLKRSSSAPAQPFGFNAVSRDLGEVDIYGPPYAYYSAILGLWSELPPYAYPSRIRAPNNAATVPTCELPGDLPDLEQHRPTTTLTEHERDKNGVPSTIPEEQSSTSTPRSIGSERFDVNVSTSDTIPTPSPGAPYGNKQPPPSSLQLPEPSSSSTAVNNTPSIVIIVVGVTGAGKTRFIKEATGLDIDIGHSPTPGMFSRHPLVVLKREMTIRKAAAEIIPYEICLGDRYGFLVEAPGFDDTCQTSIEVFEDLAAWLTKQYAQHELLTSVIYMHRITDSTVAGSALRNLTVMKKTLGVETFRNLVLVTSMWDLSSQEVGEVREKELSDRFWADLLRAGARRQRFRGDKQSASNILKEMRSEAPVTLVFQRALVDDKLQLNRTTTGTYLDRELPRSDTLNRRNTSSVHNLQLNGSSPKPRRSRTQRSITFDSDLERKNSILKAYWSASSKSLSQLNTALPPQQHRDPDMYQAFEWDYEFRLVVLRAGFGESPIEVSLVMADITNPPEFVALSHVVGKDPLDIPINFRRDRWLSQLYVSANLKDALQHLRLRNTDLLIWVDVISINQADLAERARQVRMMSQIFRAALGVCIWLGSAKDGGDEAMDFIESILDFALLEDLVTNGEQQKKWLLLAKLMSRSWFRRRWVVQELMFARSATVHCGDRVVDWSDFCDAATLFRTKWADIQHHMGEVELIELGDAHLLGAIALIEIADCVFRRDAEGNIVEKLLTTEKLLSLLPMFEVSDLLDTVYAILDMANDLDGPNSVVVNYEQEPAELYRDTVKQIMKGSGSLDIICRPWAPKSGVPSWIATVAKHPYKRRVDRQQYDRQNGVSLVGMPGSAFYRACGTVKATEGNTSFRVDGGHQVLVVTGQRIGQIEELGDRCINGNIPQEWMELVGWQPVTDPCPPEFWRSLVANRSYTGSAAPAWYGRACEFAFRKSTTDDINMTALIRSIQSSHVQEFLNRVLDVTWRRTFALVKDGDDDFFALCPPETMTGDIICIVYGCSVPVVLRQQGMYYQLVGECYVYGIMDGEAVTTDPESISTIDII